MVSMVTLGSVRFPILEREWISELNERDLAEFKVGSHEKAWWLCPEGHKYHRSIASRYAGGDCVYCNNSRVLPGFNDLNSQAPEIAAEWSSQNALSSEEVLFTSKKTFEWICVRGHTWNEAIYARTVLGRNCPFCEDKRVLEGYNDLTSIWPEISKYWSPKNPKNASEVLHSSRAIADWRCPFGHEWKARIYITLRDKSCPFCSDREVLPGFNSLDVVFPNLVAEFVSTDSGIDNIQHVLGRNSKVPMVWRCEKGHVEKQTLALFRAEYGCKTCWKAKFGPWPKISDIERLYVSWCESENPGWDPSKISANSEKKFVWKCGLGHTWKAPVQVRFQKFTECRFCAGKEVWPGFNDLASTFPEVAAEWDYTRNRITSDRIHPGNAKVFHWVCSLGHKWKASPNNRTRGRNGGTSCPACANRRVEPGFNDLQTTHPELSAQWNTRKNGTLTPSSVVFKRKDSTWWICPLGHEWSTPPRSRYRGQTLMGCPFCGNQKLLRGFNDLSTRRPDLLEFWDYQKNNHAPSDYLFGSKEVVHWICPSKHNYASPILARAYAKNNCPDCLPQITEKSVRMLETNYQKLKIEWDAEKNDGSLDDALRGRRGDRFYWNCERHGHSFKQILAKRIYGQNCPFCSGKSVLVGFNDLSTVAPELLLSWDFEKNNALKPENFTIKSGKKVWWKCDFGHPSWQSSIAHRTDERPRGCPGCKSSGFNPSLEGYLYWLRNDNWKLFKIGITNNVQQRLDQHKVNSWIPLEVIGPMDGYYTVELEADLLSLIGKKTTTLGSSKIAGKFDGYTESWSIDEFMISGLNELRQLLFMEEFLESKQ